MDDSHVLMATYLRNASDRANYSPEQLSIALGYRSSVLVQRWFEGRTLPPHQGFRRIADVLDVDVRELSIGWLIETAPTLDRALRSLLEAAGLSFPSNQDDLVKLPPCQPEERTSVPLPRRRGAAIQPPPRPKPGDYVDSDG